LFGTNASKAVIDAGWDGKSTKLDYEAYPELTQLLATLLKKNEDNAEDPALVVMVLPALDIIRRAGPPTSHRNEILQGVQHHLGSPVWHVREIAAHTVCTMVLDGGWLSTIIELIQTINQDSNLAHGMLMAIEFVLERQFSLDKHNTAGQSKSLLCEYC